METEFDFETSNGRRVILLQFWVETVTDFDLETPYSSRVQGRPKLSEHG